MYTRRRIIKQGALLLGSGLLHQLLAASRPPAFRIGACAWSLGKQFEPEAFSVAKAAGLDGVQLDLGSPDNHMQLCRREVQQTFRKAARNAGQKISGLAIIALNGHPLQSDPRAGQWLADSLEAAKALGVSVILLPFFHKGNLKQDAGGRKVVIEHLKKVAPAAEKAGIVLGIESLLDAREHMELIDAVASEHVKVYYDVANSHGMGYDIYEEIRWLGKKNICEVHLKEKQTLLGKGEIDFRQVRQALDDIGYTGWVQIEGAVPPQAPVLESHIANTAFLRTLF
jgi:L-ribulose-5-phosphate 3-epimerase